MQTFYADDGAACGGLEELKTWLQEVCKIGPKYGYFPEPSKSILVVNDSYVADAKILFEPMGLTVVTGSRYLGGFVGQSSGLKAYVEEKVEKWKSQILQLKEVANTYPHEAFSVVTRSIQARWNFLTRVVPSIKDTLGSLETCLRGEFLEKLADKKLTEDERALFSLPARMGGLGICRPTEIAESNFEASTKSSFAIAEAIRSGSAFEVARHKELVRCSKHESQRLRNEQYHDLFTEVRSRACVSVQKRMDRHFETKTSSWLTTAVSSRDGLVLSKAEFMDNFCLRYGLPFKSIPPKCDGCSADFTVQHALSCKKGGLVTQRHNEIRDVVGDMASLAWTGVVKEPEVRPATDSSPGLKADLLVRGVWHPQQNASFDIRVTDTDALSYAGKSSEQILRAAEQEKKQKYPVACTSRHITYTPLVVSVDGLLAPEFLFFIKTLALRLSEKWGKPYSLIAKWVRTRLNFAIFRATNLCIRGTRTKWRSLRFADDANLEL